MEKKRVVVVGGGVAGVNVAKALQSEALVTLVDPKDYFEIPYAALRNTVEPAFAEKSIVSYADFLPETELIQGAAADLTSTELSTSSGQKLPYDYLVISTGTLNPKSFTREERIQEFKKDNERLKKADKVLIVGGGPVGVELAGEVATDFPKKKVTVVQSSSRLIDFLGPKASSKALNWLKSKSVHVLLSERVAPSASSTYTTESGKTIEADTKFLCTGSRVNSSWLKNSFLKDSLDESGRLKVDSHLLVSGARNVFAAGDITDVKEIKQGFLAERHAKVVVENIRKLVKDPSSKLGDYNRLEQPMGLVSLGRKAAVAQLPFGTFVGCLPGLIKSRDLFVGKTRKGLGLN